MQWALASIPAIDADDFASLARELQRTKQVKGRHAMDVSSYNRTSYLLRRHDLNVVLDEIRRHDGLAVALEALVAQQLDAGFIEDDLRTVRRYRICHPGDRSRSFSLQYNPRRAMRHGGSGRTLAPAGVIPVSGGCFLCDENIAWQQRGLELGFDIVIDDVAYCCYANPFPLMPAHVTVATRAHVAQGWSAAGTEGRPTLRVLVSHLLSLAEQLPAFVVFFNGPDAGASIPAHFHFQLFKRIPAHDAFPLERSPRLAGAGGDAAPTLIDYPITVACFDGPHDTIVDRASQWMLALLSEYGNAEALSVNLMAMHTEGRLHLYVAPRDRSYSYAPGFAGLVGGLEILGELVLSTEQSRGQLRATVQWIGSPDTRNARTVAPQWNPEQNTPMRVLLSIDEGDRERVWIGQRTKVVIASGPSSRWNVASVLASVPLGW